MDETPLIYTTKGNLSVDSLVYQQEWDINEKRICFKELYYLDDELVKENTHVKVLTRG